jgi:hypothetical protein
MVPMMKHMPITAMTALAGWQSQSLNRPLQAVRKTSIHRRSNFPDECIYLVVHK